MIFQTLLVLFCSRRSAFSRIFGLVHRRVLLPAPWQCYLRLTEQTRLPLQSLMASTTTRKSFTCSAAALCKPANAEFTTAAPYFAGCNTRRYRLESRAGWKGRALDRSGWLTMLQTANYLERTAKSDDIVCFPRLTLGPAPIKHYIKKNDNHFPTCIIIP